MFALLELVNPLISEMTYRETQSGDSSISAFEQPSSCNLGAIARVEQERTTEIRLPDVAPVR
jgi:hypothetical protein